MSDPFVSFMELRFSNHESFHRAASGMVIGGFGFGALAHTIPLPHGMPAGLIGGTLGVGFGAAVAYHRLFPRMLLALLACVPMLISPTWGAMIASAAIVALSLCIGVDGLARHATFVVTALVGIVASWVAIKISYAEQTHQWSGLLVDATAASAMGILGAFSVLPRHIQFARDPIASALAKMPKTMDSEVKGLCMQAVGLWNGAKAELRNDPENRELLRQGVAKVVQVASLESSTAQSTDGLSERIAELDSRITAATDDETRSQYQSAKQALIEQKQYREQAKTKRDRLVAKLHHNVAALEKFQLAALGAAKSSDRKEVLGRLAELSTEASTTADALGEG